MIQLIDQVSPMLEKKYFVNATTQRILEATD